MSKRKITISVLCVVLLAAVMCICIAGCEDNKEEALAKASSESLEELESQVFAQSSVNSAINYIGEYFKKADLPLESDQIDTQIIQMKEDVYNQNGSSKTLETIGNIIKLDYKDETADFVIDTLEAIHNNWVQDNQSSKTLKVTVTND